MKDYKEYEIIKSSREDWIGVTFQCVIINKGNNMPPRWFTSWANAFEKHINDRFEKNEKQNDARWAKQEEFNKRVEEFMKQQLEFNKMVIDVFKRNNLK